MGTEPEQNSVTQNNASYPTKHNVNSFCYEPLAVAVGIASSYE